jgi:DNA-binding CsgD family transcriptional regulator
MLATRMHSAAQRLEENRKEAQDLQREMVALVKEAKDDGYTMVEIAEILGISRQTAYAYLEA